MADQAAEAQKFAMSLLDLDSDGKISRHDFEVLLEKSAEGEKNPARQALKQAVLKMCDAFGLVGDASFSYEEYAKRVQEKLQDPAVEAAVRQVLQAYFDLLDIDKNGYITLKEYSVFMQSLKHADPEETEAAFKSIDTSGDEKIQRAEWVNYAFEFFFTAKNDLGSGNMAGSRCCCWGYRPPCCCPPPPRPSCQPIYQFNVHDGGIGVQNVYPR